MTVRKVVDLAPLPGMVGESSPGSSLFGAASQDHQHSFDEGYRLVEGIDINNVGTGGYTVAKGTDVNDCVVSISKLGNQVYLEGWLQNKDDAATKDLLLLTIPKGFRPSPDFLPLYFKIVSRKGAGSGTITNETCKIDTDYGLKWVVAPGTTRTKHIQLFRVRYMLK